MFDLTTLLIYTGLLGCIMLLLWTKNRGITSQNYKLLGSYNRISFQEVIILLLISVIVGFRKDVGNDWLDYKEYFYQFSSYVTLPFSQQPMEIGYYSINLIAEFLGGNHTIVFLIAAIISWLFILKSFPTKLLPITFFFIFCDGYFFWSMNGVRQFMAIGIFTYALTFIIKRDVRKYLIYILIASLFHQSVLLLLPLYFVPFHKLYNQKFWIAAFVLSFIFSQTSLIIDGFQKLFLSLSSVVPFMETYIGYFDSRYFEAGQMEGSGLGYIFRILISFILLLFSKPIIKKYPQTQTYFIIFFIGTVVFNLFFMLQIVGRFATYFIFFRSYLLAVLVYYFYKKRLNHYNIVLCFLYFILFLTDIYNSANQCCPYQFGI